MDLYLVSMSLFADFVIDIKSSTIDCQISIFSIFFFNISLGKRAVDYDKNRHIWFEVYKIAKSW